MDVVSLCQLPVGSLKWQARPGAWMLTVVAKATYDLRPVESPLAAEQEFPNDDENHWDDDPARSLYSPTDLVPIKPRADVVLVGHAFAPNGETVRSLIARLLVGSIDKSIEVFSDRSFSPEGVLRHGARFSSMPLRYERAAGGSGTDNPVGIRMDARGEGALPNLQPLGARLVRPGDRFAPVGYGPIAAGWPQRKKKLGRYAATFSTRRWADAPLQDDFDRSFFNAAPPDQQLDRLEPDQRFVLENLSSWGAMMTTRLPGVRPRMIVDRGGPLEEIGVVADTLWIDNDRSICTLTFRGTLPLRHALESGRVLVVLEEPGRARPWSEIERICRARSMPDVSGEGARPEPARRVRSEKTQEFRLDEQVPALPFVAPPTEEVTGDLEDVQHFAHTATDLPDERGDASPPWLAPRVQSSPSFVGPAPVAPPPLAPPPVPPVPPPPPSLGALPPAAESGILRGFTAANGDGAIPAPARSGAFVAPPPVVPRPPESIQGGLLDVSNAAAASSTWALDDAPPREPERDAAPARERTRSFDVLDLIWVDPELVTKLRKSAAWRDLIASVQPPPPDVAYDDEPPPEEPPETKDLRDLSAVLSRGPLSASEELERALADASGEYGVIDTPIVLVAGALETPFDEVETLRATLAAAAPIAPSDKKLKESVDAVAALAQESWIEGSRGVAEGLTTRVRDAFAQAGRNVPQGWLDTHVGRRLLEQRKYEKRTVLGKTWIRALVSPNGAPPEIPTYVPEALATKLPLYPRFDVRILAALRPQQDQWEAYPLSLEVLALARVVTPARGRR